MTTEPVADTDVASFMENGLGLILMIAGAIILAVSIVFIARIAAKNRKGASSDEPSADGFAERSPYQNQFEAASPYYSDKVETIYKKSPCQPVAEQSAAQRPIVLIGQGGYFDRKSVRQTDEIVIGRHPQRCTLSYPPNENGISAVHCRLKRNGNHVEITDLASRYGTFVNGMRLTPNVPTALNPGDTFWLADPVNSFCLQS